MYATLVANKNHLSLESHRVTECVSVSGNKNFMIQHRLFIEFN